MQRLQCDHLMFSIVEEVNVNSETQGYILTVFTFSIALWKQKLLCLYTEHPLAETVHPSHQ